MLAAKKSLLITLVVVGALSAPALADNFSWRGTISAGDSLEIEAYRGEIIATSSSGSEAEVEIEKEGEAGVAAAVKIEVENDRGGIRIHASYPKEDPELMKRVEVRVRVKVPAGIRFIGRLSEGDIEARSLQSPVDLYSVAGDIRFSTSSYGQARTVKGTIEAELGATNWSGRLEFSSVQGDITVKLPPGADLELLAESARGSFSTDYFPQPEMASSRGGTRIRGEVGRGGRKLEMKNVRGSLRLLKVG
ncbi:MAG TPA: DUF4097 family beta strand repeat-containing protein [Thermoanaerobaculia bacterium]|nr:DUF4097 family beta strand repeat-containing protein [Thermoanaerobaculia bacterium]